MSIHVNNVNEAALSDDVLTANNNYVIIRNILRDNPTHNVHRQSTCVHTQKPLHRNIKRQLGHSSAKRKRDAESTNSTKKREREKKRWH